MNQPVTTLPEWIEMIREIVQRTGQAVRAGEGDWIEAQSINTAQWHPLEPPGGSIHFHSTQARDEALQRIQTNFSSSNNKAEAIPTSKL